MSIFTLREWDTPHVEVKVCFLLHDEECYYDDSKEELCKSTFKESTFRKIETFIDLISQGNNLPKNQYEQLKRDRTDPYEDFELKARLGKNQLRVYSFKDNETLIIVHAALKKNEKGQKKDIKRLRIIKELYFESKNQLL